MSDPAIAEAESRLSLIEETLGMRRPRGVRLFREDASPTAHLQAGLGERGQSSAYVCRGDPAPMIRILARRRRE
jgi:hypothetical protein